MYDLRSVDIDNRDIVVKCDDVFLLSIFWGTMNQPVIKKMLFRLADLLKETSLCKDTNNTRAD